ncbi:SPOR domain-containing protein [Loktanella sp. Alg231-35]|uniref:SPOR domain-containing protein n=1 Tax=Loktanella sp. Alg231-35 TaxID=1922220 RepID=UPI001F44BF95|nr:SPOR domain-containing protein [Loktanella sp. Alg231-35]
MTGTVFMNASRWRMSMALIAAMGLAACDENGGFALPTAGEDASEPLPANAPNQTVQSERDVERPDIFEVTDRGLWDGRPSLGGVWVAHPDAQDPERVMIVNTENGREIVGALFRRERENPGPLLQVSSDAAEELGILAGAPTELSVVALRREEVEVEATPQENPVVASLAAPVAVESEALDPVEPASEESAEDDAPVAVVLPPAGAAASNAVEAGAAAAATAGAAIAAETADVISDTAEAAEEVDEAVDVSAVIAAPPEPLPPGTIAQVGIYSVEANAGAAAKQIIDAGIPANVFAQEVGGRTVWRVVAGPLADDSAVSQLKAMGFVDAFIVDDDGDDAAEE